MSTKHTPGPWLQNLPEDSVIYGADGWPICEMGGNNHARVEADACLIAAAPDLLEALVTALEEWRGWYEDSRGRDAETDFKEFRRCKAILLKANGESQ